MHRTSMFPFLKLVRPWNCVRLQQRTARPGGPYTTQALHKKPIFTTKCRQCCKWQKRENQDPSRYTHSSLRQAHGQVPGRQRNKAQAARPRTGVTYSVVLSVEKKSSARCGLCVGCDQITNYQQMKLGALAMIQICFGHDTSCTPPHSLLNANMLPSRCIDATF